MHFSKIVLIYLVLSLATGKVTISERPDPLASIVFGKNYNIDRVVILAEVNYTYTFGGDYWKAFPEMVIQFDLPFAQYVNLKYHIATATGGTHWMVTRLLIDDVEHRGFRHVSGFTYDHNPSASDDVYLSQGRHFAKVQYRTNAASSQIHFDWDWVHAFFKVTYYKPGELIQNDVPKKLTKKVRAPDDYSLMNNNKWEQFSGLILTVTLQYDQQIEVNYRIVTSTNPQCFLAIRVKIDGEVEQTFDNLSWDTNLHQIAAFGRKTWVKKGPHFLQLQYKTQGSRDRQVGSQFQTAYMEIVYHRK